MRFTYFFATLITSSFGLLIKRDPINDWTGVLDSLTTLDLTNATLGWTSECEVWELVKQVASTYPTNSYDFCTSDSEESLQSCRDCLELPPQDDDRLQEIQLFIQTGGECGIFEGSSLYGKYTDLIGGVLPEIPTPSSFNSSQTSTFSDTSGVSDAPSPSARSSTDTASSSASVVSDYKATTLNPPESDDPTSSESPPALISTSIHTAYATVMATVVTTTQPRSTSRTATIATSTGGGAGPFRLSSTALLITTALIGGLFYF